MKQIYRQKLQTKITFTDKLTDNNYENNCF